jgi:sugar phosphate isomerase/epimerase
MSAAERATQLTRECQQHGNQAWALWMIGEAAEHRSEVAIDVVAERYREARDLASELGMRPLVAHCHLGLGKLYRRTDRREQAREHLTTATTMYREMGMTYWLEKAEAELNA